MPHVELKYSENISLDVDAIFKKIETLINTHDSSAGVCKSRAYPAKAYLHSHVLINISVLPKPHRDQAFMDQLLKELEALLLAFLPDGIHYTVHLYFSGQYYLTSTT